MSALDPMHEDRLKRLLNVCARETAGLKQVEARLFAKPLDPQQLLQLEQHPDLSERIDAFAARFGRLQDPLEQQYGQVALAL